MNNEVKMRLASAGIDITEIIPADSIVVPKTLWNEWAEKIEQMGNQQHATEAEPIQPDTPKMIPGEKPHMRRDVAAGILMDLMRKRTMSVDHVEALKMGAHWLMKKHFEKQRYHAKRREAAASVPAVPTVPTVPATTTEA